MVDVVIELLAVTAALLLSLGACLVAVLLSVT